ncbi:MAG: hypothetical protein DHS20C15_30240 [Planctomycetota bacterium]|nr:MAG: hypothetical protein DHS20C15_30240 [Planctomycetota bacterium]
MGTRHHGGARAAQLVGGRGLAWTSWGRVKWVRKWKRAAPKEGGNCSVVARQVLCPQGVALAGLALRVS